MKMIAAFGSSDSKVLEMIWPAGYGEKPWPDVMSICNDLDSLEPTYLIYLRERIDLWYDY